MSEEAPLVVGWIGRLDDVDTHSTGQVAEHLGTSVPTVRRAARRLGVGTVDDGGRLRLNADEVTALERAVGRVPRVDGFRRSQVQILATLALAPLGLRSERAVARASRTSPTTAGRALRALVDAGLVRYERRILAEGTAVEGGLWRLRIGPQWFRFAPVVATTVLPERKDRAEPPRRLPRRLWHLFWNANPARLDLEADAEYIATRLLLADDLQGLAWACAHSPAAALRAAARNRGVDAPTRGLVEDVLRASARSCADVLAAVLPDVPGRRRACRAPPSSDQARPRVRAYWQRRQPEVIAQLDRQDGSPARRSG